MSTSHHGHNDDKREQTEIMKRLIDQFENRARREYSHGRTGPDDEGKLAYAIAADKDHGIVRISFGKPVDWLGLTPTDAVKLAEVLIAKAREVSKEPLAVSI